MNECHFNGWWEITSAQYFDDIGINNIGNIQLSNVSFANLPDGALGETVGEGLNAQITLDDNAAGHGWYIDYTPYLNSDDFLPTADPWLWRAKADSPAYGKMDLLSVLLHEYGHALGLQHSATR